VRRHFDLHADGVVIPLRVAVDARLVPGTSGGVETVVRGLAQGFAELDAEDLALTFVTYSGTGGWLDSELGAKTTVREVSRPNRVSVARDRMRLFAYRRRAGTLALAPGHDFVMDRVPADVVHMPFQQSGFVSAPFIYHPHDLQHCHMPEFFTPRQLANREVTYAAMCARAAAVAVGCSWVKDDVVTQLGLDPDRIHVVPLAPFVSEPTGIPDIQGLDLPPRYLIYPAANWPHKNHDRLFRALAQLRERGVTVPLVLTGSTRAGNIDLNALAAAAGATGLVRHLGYLSPSQLKVVTEGASAMIVPTLFEAESFPIWEAFRLGVPVACSNVTSIPRQVGDAALVFDPYDVEAIARAIEVLWTRPHVSQDLARRGRARVAGLSWQATARHFLALYRLLAQRATDQDLTLLAQEPTL
jgi:glycosyltransferase involved in cell wall biosynthesis